MAQAGFAEIDITPPIGTAKIGWIMNIITESVADPLFARAAVIKSGDNGIGFLALDLLWVEMEDVARIRSGIEERYGFPGSHVMVAASHNHAGPAVAQIGEVCKDNAYVETLIAKCVDVFGQALKSAEEAEIGFGHAFEWNVAHNRRIVMRDGTARTHGTFDDPDALYVEGPIDPEVAVLAARGMDGKLLGCMVNFACHPTHHGGDSMISAGYPGILASEMKKRGCPVTLFLNGPSGNIHTADPAKGGQDTPMETAGLILAEDVTRALESMSYEGDVNVTARSTTVRLPYREITEDEIRGTVRGAQRFMNPNFYDEIIPDFVREKVSQGSLLAEVQTLSIGECDYLAIPAEYFVEYGLRIKEEAHPRHALVVATVNGHVGYVPTKAAFKRGGYETTFCPWSYLAPEAGNMLADAAIDLIKSGAKVI